MAYPLLPLSVANDKERQRSWEGISTPHDIALYIARMLAVDPNKLLQLNEITYSDLEPTGDDAKKIWIKTEEPIGIGIPVGGQYSIIYKYPPHTPILWTQGMGNLPSYMRELSSIEMEDYSLTEPASNKVAWVIFQP